jgi:hypothetical protein
MELPAFSPVMCAHVEAVVALALTVFGWDDGDALDASWTPAQTQDQDWQLCASMTVLFCAPGDTSVCAACAQTFVTGEESYACSRCLQTHPDSVRRQFHPTCWLRCESDPTVFECPDCKTHLVA